MGATEQTVFEQFSNWKSAFGATTASGYEADLNVFIGCGTSYNPALSLAALSNDLGRPAMAVPGGEWANRPRTYWPRWAKTHVIALSRSGETTETVASAKASRAAGAFVTAITVERDSSIVRNCDRLLAAETHPKEGIVMTVSRKPNASSRHRFAWVRHPPCQSLTPRAGFLQRSTPACLRLSVAARMSSISVAAGASSNFITFNNSVPPVGDVRVRQAIAMAILATKGKSFPIGPYFDAILEAYESQAAN